ncbi:MAG: hypothetical protein HOP13_05385 [Alphaproteobacteria bacterium]|nr:hypothetical protein [Alphaproteobacteria bacterium]
MSVNPNTTANKEQKALGPRASRPPLLTRRQHEVHRVSPEFLAFDVWGIRARLLMLIGCAALISGAGEPPVGVRGDPVAPAKISIDGETLRYEGQIDNASVDEVERVLAAASSVSTLVINSPGGSDAGVRFGEIVFARKLAVTVHKVCASACANWVALPARELVVPNDAILAFHGGTMNMTEENEKFWRGTLKARGAGEDMIETSVRHMKEMRTRELALFKAIGVSYKILEDSQTRRGRSTSRLWMFTRDVLENCYNVRNIKQYPKISPDQTLIDGWAEVIRECPSGKK